jgi:hypothetical protein
MSDDRRSQLFKNVAAILVGEGSSEERIEAVKAVLIREGVSENAAQGIVEAMVAGCNATFGAVKPQLDEFKRLEDAHKDLEHFADSLDDFAFALEEHILERKGDLEWRDDRLDVTPHWPPVVLTRCAECGVGTLTLNESFMVKDDVWVKAWAGRMKSWQRRAPGQMVLCIGCLEAHIGRMLRAVDFTDTPLNDLDHFHMSARLLDRLRRPSARIGKPPDRKKKSRRHGRPTARKDG